VLVFLAEIEMRDPLRREAAVPDRWPRSTGQLPARFQRRAKALPAWAERTEHLIRFNIACKNTGEHYYKFRRLPAHRPDCDFHAQRVKRNRGPLSRRAFCCSLSLSLSLSPSLVNPDAFHEGRNRITTHSRQARTWKTGDCFDYRLIRRDESEIATD
jgi:hypothetical protein